jgi:hypothetical protein
LRIWAIDAVTGLEIPSTGIPMPSVLYTPDGMQHDPRTDTFWASNDQATVVYHISKTGGVLGSFTIPFLGQLGNTGIGFDGCHLWLSLINPGNSPVQNRLVMVTDTGQPLTFFDYFDAQHCTEDIEIDGVSAAPDILIWGHSASAGSVHRLKAWSIGRMTQVVQSDSQGQYTFGNLQPGQYSVRQTPYFGYGFTSPSNGVHTVTVSTSFVYNRNFGNKASPNKWNPKFARI